MSLASGSDAPNHGSVGASTTADPDLPLPGLDAEYRQVREECGLLEHADRAWIEVTGPDAAEFVHGQVTNEIEALEPGSGCYALLLDRKGKLQADMRVLRTSPAELLIETGVPTRDRLLKHLGMYKIGRKVDVTPAERTTVSLVGPGAIDVTGLAPGDEHDFTSTRIAGADCLAVATDLGIDIVCEPGDAAAVREELQAKRAIPVSSEAVEILRVESGRPRFGSEMTEASMPAEAGIVDRAISFTKGCYIGQEPVARLHYKGRPNRHLRGLRFEGAVEAGDTVRLGERELGTVGTVVLSPASGRIGLAILRKEAEPGSTVTVVSESGETEASVVEPPFIESPGP
ncbi:MAG: folate-binding protein [Actinomycetota bacterium]|nr:folate-binding protein [Actinomycetota bacterium]